MEFKPSGCYECNSGYIAASLPAFTNTHMCVKNESLATNNTVTSDKFVTNCESNYYDNVLNKIRCLKCSTDYILV